MLTTTLAVNVARPSEEPATEWFNVIAFGAVGDLLARHHKGDAVDIMGPLTRSTYSDREGNPCTRWGVSAEAILSARTACDAPAPKRRKPSASPRSRDAARQSLYSPPQKPGGTSELPDDPVGDLWQHGRVP
jgi:single-stranded DNA-binding protein